MEGAVCGRKAISLSYAFFSRNHDPKIIAGATSLSVRLIEHLYKQWPKEVDLYSINVPLVEGVENHKIVFTHMLQNAWSSGSCFEEVDADEEPEDPGQQEMEIREQTTPEFTRSNGQARFKHKHFKWAPKFVDVHTSVEKSTPGKFVETPSIAFSSTDDRKGNDGWAVKEGFTRYGYINHEGPPYAD